MSANKIVYSRPHIWSRSFTSSMDRDTSQSWKSVGDIQLGSKFSWTFFELGELSGWKSCISVDAWGGIWKLSNVDSTIDDSIENSKEKLN